MNIHSKTEVTAAVMPPLLSPIVPLARTNRRPLGLRDVVITGGQLRMIQKLNSDSIIPHCDASLEDVGWVKNFEAAAEGRLASDRVGRLFTDSEIYKTLEAMIWEDARTQSSRWSERIHVLASHLMKAQSPDGYLNTYYGYAGGPERYSDLEWGHELYCHGHLLQAAVASIRANANTTLTEVAMRAARHICEEFADGRRESLCGHPEIETALVELYRATGEPLFLEQASLFVDRRGHQVLADTMYGGRDYYQDNEPVRKAESLVGHSVRALYLAAGAIDVAVETADYDLLQAVQRQYDRTLGRRTYLTGGMGSNHHGETYGDDFELPSERAYAETCAGVASLHVAWRLLLATGEERYADVMERTLYNTILSSPSLDGTEFFYVNTLHRRVPGVPPEPGVPSLRRTDGLRARWFTTACCPNNIARLFASLGCYLASTSGNELALHLYSESRVAAELDSGLFEVQVETAYPLDGKITITVLAAPRDAVGLAVRIPAWARNSHFANVEGDQVVVQPGRHSVYRRWKAGDSVSVLLPMAPRWTFPNRRIDHLRGSVAVERGPLVYAAESVDNPNDDLECVAVNVEKPMAEKPLPEQLGEGVAIVVAGVHTSLEPADWPYGVGPSSGKETPIDLVLIPYAKWANRGGSTMRVWLPEASN